MFVVVGAVAVDATVAVVILPIVAVLHAVIAVLEIIVVVIGADEVISVIEVIVVIVFAFEAEIGFRKIIFVAGSVVPCAAVDVVCVEHVPEGVGQTCVRSVAVRTICTVGSHVLNVRLIVDAVTADIAVEAGVGRFITYCACTGKRQE